MFFLFPKVKGNKARLTDRQTSPSSAGVRPALLDVFCCFIKTPRSTFASFRARKRDRFHIYSSTFIYFLHVSGFLIHIYPFPIFCISVLIIFKLCIYAVSISLNHSNYGFLDCDWFKKLILPLMHLLSCYRTGCYLTL